eukprot:scaffold1639_cov331-Pavlova_lutheri.AAC.5
MHLPASHRIPLDCMPVMTFSQSQTLHNERDAVSLLKGIITVDRKAICNNFSCCFQLHKSSKSDSSRMRGFEFCTHRRDALQAGRFHTLKVRAPRKPRRVLLILADDWPLSSALSSIIKGHEALDATDGSVDQLAGQGESRDTQPRSGRSQPVEGHAHTEDGIGFGLQLQPRRAQENGVPGTPTSTM